MRTILKKETTKAITTLKMGLLATLVSVFFISCGGDDAPVAPPTPEPEPEPSSAAIISSLNFKTAQNTILYQDVTAQVDESTKVITATVTVIVPHADLNNAINLIPDVSFSNKATIEPANNTAVTVGGATTTPVIYKVTAEDGTTTKSYTLKTTVKYINALAKKVIALEDLVALYAIKEANPSATGVIAVWKLNGSSEATIRNSLTGSGGVTINADKRIARLTIRRSNLSTLPAEIGNLTALTYLNVSKNSLEELPSEIGNLTAIESITFLENSLQTVPDSFANFTNIRELDFKENNFKTIPAVLLQLTTLEFIGFWKNNLSELPSEIGNLTALTGLDLEYNNLGSLPSTIGNLTNLKRLYLQFNDLRPDGLPDEMTNLTALTDLELKNNSKLTGKPVTTVLCNFFKNTLGGVYSGDLDLSGC